MMLFVRLAFKSAVMRIILLYRIILPYWTWALILAAVCVGCGSSGGGNSERLPVDLSAMSDTERVAYMMEHVEPDSVARFICDASLGRVGNVHIDSLPTATLYVYEHYRDSALVAFSQEYESYSASLPLADKMRLYSMAGTDDPMRMGYRLGLEYVSEIRDRHMSVAQVEEELAALRQACGEDTLTYERFLKGFRTVLHVDHGRDLPEEIYKKLSD